MLELVADKQCLFEKLGLPTSSNQIFKIVFKDALTKNPDMINDYAEFLHSEGIPNQEISGYIRKTLFNGQHIKKIEKVLDPKYKQGYRRLNRIKGLLKNNSENMEDINETMSVVS